ncbi:hypothetical protein cyc_04274 [Cyclospora cayetanensis]|uniref:Secreted protein n=1 Tax=Cyclospora cayetanensis TaxID=88456 RepID=A0A1D3D0R1_9EIME|nr:hypothetical protein cyc_04274 [Cyclospora cayetanensis]
MGTSITTPSLSSPKSFSLLVHGLLQLLLQQLTSAPSSGDIWDSRSSKTDPMLSCGRLRRVAPSNPPTAAKRAGEPLRIFT